MSSEAGKSDLSAPSRIETVNGILKGRGLGSIRERSPRATVALSHGRCSTPRSDAAGKSVLPASTLAKVGFPHRGGDEDHIDMRRHFETDLQGVIPIRVSSTKRSVALSIARPLRPRGGWM
jgi:hypothetical protein